APRLSATAGASRPQPARGRARSHGGALAGPRRDRAAPGPACLSRRLPVGRAQRFVADPGRSAANAGELLGAAARAGSAAAAAPAGRRLGDRPGGAGAGSAARAALARPLRPAGDAQDDSVVRGDVPPVGAAAVDASAAAALAGAVDLGCPGGYW